MNEIEFDIIILAIAILYLVSYIRKLSKRVELIEQRLNHMFDNHDIKICTMDRHECIFGEKRQNTK